MIAISSAAQKRTSLNIPEKQLRTKILNLTQNLRCLRKNEPKMNCQQHESIKSSEKRNKLSIDNQISAQSSEISKKVTKAKINWNTSATCWTRDKSPAISIPKAKRFLNNNKQSNDYLPQVHLNLRTSINKNGVSFAQSSRKQLFKSDMTTPSPQKYHPKRYLDNLAQSPRKYIICPVNTQQPSDIEHISGGTIGKFYKYENLYYPHTKKLQYNQKIICEAYDNKSFSQPHSKNFKSI